MQIQELSSDSRLWQAIVASQHATTKARASGLHLSQITNDIAATVYPKDFWYLVRDHDAAPPEFDARTRATFEAGHVIEELIARIMAARAGWAKPDPVRCEGVWCSPDGWQQSTRTIDEMKATWKSSRDFLQTTKFQLYLWQVQAYMFALGATRARLHVMHMNGDYRPPRPEPPKTYILRPSREEIDSNWRMIKTHAKDRGWLPQRHVN